MSDVHAQPIGQLLEHCSHWPLLSSAEELALARRIERGDLSAKERLINSNIRLVVSISRSYVGLGLAQEDVVQDGMVGLMRAAEKFDWRRGLRFSTYATAWIRQSIQRGLDQGSRTVRLPIKFSQLARKLAGARNRLTATLGREPTDAELAGAAGVDVEVVRHVAQLDRPAVSLDAPVGPDGTTALGDLLEAPRPASEAGDETAAAITGILDRLPPPERVIVELRYGHNDRGQEHTRTEACLAAGISLRRGTLLEQVALDRLANDPEMVALRDAA